MPRPWILVRSNSQPGEDNNVSACLKWIKFICCRTRVWIVISIILSVVIIALAISADQQNRKIKDERRQDAKSLFLTSGSDADNGVPEIVLCINEQKSTCRNPSCFSCADEIVPYFEPLNCIGGNILTKKNERCFQCRNDCLTYQELLDEPLKCPGQDAICCVHSKMGNPEDRKCSCYSAMVHELYNKSRHEPICTCLVGSETKGCNKMYTQTARCKCFKSTYKLCGQEQIIECDSERIRSNWTKCHRVITKNDSEYNCVCTKPTATEPADDLSSC